MMLKKQTVWLLTMLTLMVVLSAYYLFNSEPTNMDDLANTEEMEWDAVLDNTDLTSLANSDTTTTDTDYFLSFRIDRDAFRAKQLEDYEKMMTSEASAQAIAEAKGKWDKLQDLQEAELTLETLIKQEGYDEAVVVADLEKVNVIVKSDDALEKKAILNIIQHVRNVLDVPGTQVKVTRR